MKSIMLAEGKGLEGRAPLGKSLDQCNGKMIGRSRERRLAEEECLGEWGEWGERRMKEERGGGNRMVKRI